MLLSFSYLDLEEHVRFGRAIGEALDGGPTSGSLYVASSDLSHRLHPRRRRRATTRGPPSSTGPWPTPSRPGDWEALLSIDPGLVEAAGECGYRSLAVLSGVVAAVRGGGQRDPQPPAVVRRPLRRGLSGGRGGDDACGSHSRREAAEGRR